jgi:putative drug exporter of the RND superfamily
VNLLLEKLAGTAARRHWIFIIAWVAILGGLLGAKHAFSGEFVNNYTISGSDSANGIRVLNETFPQQGGYGGQIVFHARSGTVSAQQSAVNQSVSNVSKLPDVIKAVSPFASAGSGTVSKDETIAYANVSWSVNPSSLDTSYLDKLNNAVAPATTAGLQVAYGAGAGQIGQQTQDLKSEAIGLACALVLLLIMFGSLIAAGIPLVAAIFSVLSGLALLGLLARVVTFPTTAPTIATLLGLGVAVDYGLFMVARHREQLDAGMEVQRSIRRTAGTSGAAIVVAGSTVAISVLGLYISGVGFVGTLGLAAAIVVVVTMIAALTLVPAVLGLARETIRALTARVRARKARLTAQQQAAQTAAATREQHEKSAFARWGRMVSDRPWPWGIASIAILVVLAIPLFSITLGQPDNGTNPTSQSNRVAYDLISQGFGVGANGPLTVVVKLPNQSGSANSSLLSAMQSGVAATAGVASVTPASVNSSGTTAVFNVIPDTRPQATQTTALVTTLRDDVLPKEHATSYVTGTVAGNVDFTSKITSRLAWLIIAVVVISFFLLTAAFRSIVIATKAAILNVLSIGAAYGVIVAIFEWGWAKDAIGLQSTLPIPAYVPMLVFCIVFGLSMDYEVFLLSRVHEAWLATGDAHRSVAIGIGATARVITTAALIMIVVFTSFVINPNPTVKMLAIGMAFAVLIDASLVRMILVPSIMSLLGARAWWLPRWLGPLVPSLELEGSVALPGPRSAADDAKDAKEEPRQARPLRPAAGVTGLPQGIRGRKPGSWRGSDWLVVGQVGAGRLLTSHWARRAASHPGGRGLEDELIRRAGRRGLRRDVVEQAVVLVAGQDEDGLLPHLGVGGDGVDLARHELRSGRRQVRRVLVGVGRRQDPAHRRQAVGHRVVLELAHRRGRHALVEQRVAGLGVEVLRDVRDGRQPGHAAGCVVDLPAHPGRLQPLGVGRERVDAVWRAGGQRRPAELAVRVHGAGHPHVPVRAGGPEHRAMVGIADRERLRQGELERDVLAGEVAHGVRADARAVGGDVRRQPVVVRAAVERRVLHGPLMAG